jgi:hypothetical protein
MEIEMIFSQSARGGLLARCRAYSPLSDSQFSPGGNGDFTARIVRSV